MFCDSLCRFWYSSCFIIVSLLSWNWFLGLVDEFEERVQNVRWMNSVQYRPTSSLNSRASLTIWVRRGYDKISQPFVGLSLTFSLFSLVQAGGAEEALAAALAYISGLRESLETRSLLGGLQNYTTILLTPYQVSSPLNSILSSLFVDTQTVLFICIESWCDSYARICDSCRSTHARWREWECW
jgi:hypothetical protein